MRRFALAVLALAAFAGPAFGDHAAGHAMDNKRLGELLRELDADTQGEPGFWYLDYNVHPT